VADSDGHEDITQLLFAINESDGTRRYTEILLRYYRGSLRMWNHTENRWNTASFGENVILEDDLCSVDVSQCSISGNADLLVLNLNITPKQAFIDPPFTSNKTIWLELRDAARNIITNVEIGACTIN
jgi:hypothetical protein